MSFSSSITYFIYLLPILRATSNNQQYYTINILNSTRPGVPMIYLYLFHQATSFKCICVISTFLLLPTTFLITSEIYTLIVFVTTKYYCTMCICLRVQQKIVFSSKNFYQTKYKTWLQYIPGSNKMFPSIRGLHLERSTQQHYKL